MDDALEVVEYRLLCEAVRDACRELRWGHPLAGRSYLLEGLERIAEFADAGVPWADRLADEYRRALREFDQLAEPYLQRLRAFRLAGGDPLI